MKNVILLNSRSLNFYNFKDLKKNYSFKITILMFEDQAKYITKDIKNFVDKVYFLPSKILDFDPIFSIEKIKDIIHKEVNKNNETWLVASDELHNLEVSFIREEFNIPGIPSSIIKNYRDKITQKKLLNNKLKTPRFYQVKRDLFKKDSNKIYKKLLHALNSPFILKPVNMFGTIGVRKINSYEDFQKYMYDFQEIPTLIAEELITGKLYHCDFIIQDKNYYFSEVSEYLWNGLSFLDGKNHGSLLLLHDNTARNRIIDFCKEANAILGLKNGCAHFEVFINEKQEIIFLEAAARPAGSMVPVVYSKIFGENFLNLALLAEIGEPIEKVSNIYTYSFWALFPQQAGIVKKLIRPSLRSSNEIKWFTKRGDLLEKAECLKHKIGSLTATNQCYNEIQEDFYKLKYFNTLQTT